MAGTGILFSNRARWGLGAREPCVASTATFVLRRRAATAAATPGRRARLSCRRHSGQDRVGRCGDGRSVQRWEMRPCHLPATPHLGYLVAQQISPYLYRPGRHGLAVRVGWAGRAGCLGGRRGAGRRRGRRLRRACRPPPATRSRRCPCSRAPPLPARRRRRRGYGTPTPPPPHRPPADAPLQTRTDSHRLR